ncbi:MAG TPA: hypothetical protein ACQGQH_09045 [Xylella sp.]
MNSQVDSLKILTAAMEADGVLRVTRNEYSDSQRGRKVMIRTKRAMLATAMLASMAGCASTTHYYSASDYRGIRVGDARVTSGVSVEVSPSGVSVIPRVRYYLPRTTKKSDERD